MASGGVSIWKRLTLIATLISLIHALTSNEFHGGAKFSRLPAVSFFSRLELMIFLILTRPAKSKALPQNTSLILSIGLAVRQVAVFAFIYIGLIPI